MAWCVIVGVVIIGAGFAVVAHWKVDPCEREAEAAPMPAPWRRFLALYLLALGALLVCGLVQLCGVDFPETTFALEASLLGGEAEPLDEPTPEAAAAATPAPASGGAGGAAGSTAAAGAAGAPPVGGAGGRLAPGEASGGGTAQTSGGAGAAQASGGALATGGAATGGAATGGASKEAARSGTGGVPAVEARPPRLLHVFPSAALGAATTLDVAIYGENLQPEAKVRFNGRPRPVQKLNSRLLRATPVPADLLGVGSLTVDVENPDHQLSNALSIAVVHPRMPLCLLGIPVRLTREMQILLLVLCAGALGSYVHALKSLSDFIGNRTLIASWFWWYITRPFLGMAMALVFYAVLRGGFLTGSMADAHVVNPFGAMAVAALVGMFSDTAAQKLAEIFDTLFKTADARGGKMAAPVIDHIDPPNVVPNVAREVQLIGERLGSVVSVRVDGNERKPKAVSEKSVTLQLDPGDVATVRKLPIAVVAPDGVSPSVALFVTDLKIDTETLPPATAAEGYEHALAASGGKDPRKWALPEAPKSLKLDESTGKLSGIAESPGKFTLKAQVRDDMGAVVAKDLKLEVKLPPPHIDHIDPPKVLPQAPRDVQLIGERLGKVVSVRVDGQERKPKAVSEKSVTLQLDAADVAKPRKLDLAVVAEDGAASPSVALFVTDLEITTSTLTAGEAAKQYSRKLEAKNGVSPYKWALTGAPAWLTVNAATGELSGTAVAGKFTFEATVTDATLATVTTKLELEVK